jgi:outer membrane lipoprotein
MYDKLLSLMLLGLLLGCASTPDFDTAQVDSALTPQAVIAEPELNRGKIVLWGGTILDTRNLKEVTQVEILAYPLSSSHRPLLDKKPLGRFIMQQQGYLEPTSYAQGRLLTVMGKVTETQSGKVGDSTYTYPVITATQLYLWNQADDNDTSIHFGLGIGIQR